MNTELFVSVREKLTENLRKVILGKDEVIRQVAVCFIAGGHVLLEDLPGTGKTMLLRAFSKSIGGDFKRIQFTPDLLPSDLTGVNFYNMQRGEFEFRPGALFANVILADEINRAIPRSQSALLEAMEEKQISVDGVTYPLQWPYMVMATQNPVESYGTFPLPEAQLDRFFMKLSLGYMTREQEMEVLRRKDSRELLEEVEQVITAEELSELQKSYPEVRVSDDVTEYIMSLVDYTRNSKSLLYGVSTRGSLALYRASQITAAMEGRDYVIPEDVRQEAEAVLSHRIQMTSNTHLENGAFIKNMLAEVPVPLEKL